MWKLTAKGIEIPLKIFPNASHNDILSWENGELKIRVAASPEKGGANEELINFLSERLKIPKSKIKIISGASSRHKRICLIDIDPKKLTFLTELQ